MKIAAAAGEKRQSVATNITSQVLNLWLLAILCSGCGGVRLGNRTAVRSAIFHTSYDEAKAALSKMHAGVKWEGQWIGVYRTEKLPDGQFVVSILEGGSDWHKFAHRTTVNIIKKDDSSCWIEINSWANNVIWPSHRMWFTEWKRWREVKRLLKNA